MIFLSYTADKKLIGITDSKYNTFYQLPEPQSKLLTKIVNTKKEILAGVVMSANSERRLYAQYSILSKGIKILNTRFIYNKSNNKLRAVTIWEFCDRLFRNDGITVKFHTKVLIYCHTNKKERGVWLVSNSSSLMYNNNKFYNITETGFLLTYDNT